MSSSQPPKGRGRGRGSVASSEPPPPAINLSIDTSAINEPTTHQTTQSSTIIVTDQSLPKTSTFSSIHESTPSAPTTIQSSVTSSSTSSKGGRGRGRQLKQDLGPPDPFWMVSNLTYQQFFSNDRAPKPQELGTLGRYIQVIVNYFPVSTFPRNGLAYKYQIKVYDRKNLEIHRDRRR